MTLDDGALSDSDRRILLHDLRHTLDSEWLPDVLVALSQEPLSYTGLLGRLQSYEAARVRRWPPPVVRDSVLHRTLRWMQDRGLVEHDRDEVWPFAAVYRLTPPARELARLVLPIAEWAAAHEDLLELDRKLWAERRRRRKNGKKGRRSRSR
ncbi:transcriptional regulator [Frankia sp. B2]|uniref:winged helix-turn-helix transcriptional regulator n=1 Tax=unclassified Frankia TaxID=2632575 RepID=UPI0006CA3321|nr:MULTISPECIES: winged helix-turn-helix transcriptional regulator [unclassified Frankia]KPM52696.1 transcriptional regulator [Frankia sp. R43]TFE26241.1 transcriptional regulator [Frankia sp. B2]